jgi:hypothetical protein
MTDNQVDKVNKVNKVNTVEQKYPRTKQALVYNFIYDEEQVKRFARLIDSENTYQLLCIVSRPKYHKGSLPNRHMSPRTFAKYSPERYLEQVRKYEQSVGYYTEDGVAFPDDSFVIYASTNGLNGKSAAKKFVGDILDAAFETSADYIFEHLNGKLNSALMAVKANVKLITIDIDAKDELAEVKEFLAEHKVTPAATIETHGGYHVLIKVEDLVPLKGSLHKKFAQKHTIKDMMCAVPGTLQAGFPVRFVD